MKSFFAGLLGGMCIVGIIILILFFTNSFNYQIQIINPKAIDSLNYATNKTNIIREMEKNGVLLTPQEYTNNIVNYYNVALTIMASLLVVFSVISYFHIKFVSEEQLKGYLKSPEFFEEVKASILGKTEEHFATTERIEDLEASFEEIKDLKTELEALKEDISEKPEN